MNGKLQLNLSHKIQTENVHKPIYEANGTGRDVYISSNNGGFHRNYQPEPPRNSYMTAGSVLHHYKYQQDPKTIHYKSDGSGRDYYIASDDGGLQKVPGVQKQYNYDGDLRQYQKTSSWIVNKPDWYQLAQQGKLHKNSKSMIKQIQTQQNSQQRLSKPKNRN